MANLPIDRPPRHVVVVADGDLASREALDAAWPGWDDGMAEVIAADGGLLRARAIGLEPGVLVGDLDSLGAEGAEQAAHDGLEVRRSSADKDESDTELALLAAVARGATRITLIGALGGRRLDHALANIWLLGHAALDAVDVVVLDEAARVSVLVGPGTRRLPGPVGGTVSLLPLGGVAEGITTEGFRYPLRDEPLRTGPARGLSNVRTAPEASVTLRGGRLLVVEPGDAAAGLDSIP
jgi:thiamine pyrophosphokinase